MSGILKWEKLKFKYSLIKTASENRDSHDNLKTEVYIAFLHDLVTNDDVMPTDNGRVL